MTKLFELESTTTPTGADPAIEAARWRKRADLGRALALLKEASAIARAEPADLPDPGDPLA